MPSGSPHCTVHFNVTTSKLANYGVLAYQSHYFVKSVYARHWGSAKYAVALYGLAPLAWVADTWKVRRCYGGHDRRASELRALATSLYTMHPRAIFI